MWKIYENLLGGLGVIAIGIFVCWCMSDDIRQGFINSSWPTTTGKVVESKYHKSTIPYTEFSYKTIHYAKIFYRYSVDGSHYTSERFRYWR